MELNQEKLHISSYLPLGLAVLLWLSIASISLFTWSCQDTQVAEGKALAQQHCATCHALPSPGILPNNVWKYSTLPYMGTLMGVQKEIDQLQKPLSDYAILKSPQALISDDDWDKIKAYYLAESPAKFPETKTSPIAPLENLFSVEDLPVKLDGGTFPNFTAIKIDEASRQIIAGDQSNRIIWLLDKQGKAIQQWKDQNALTHVEGSRGKYRFTYIGTTTQANPEVNGVSHSVTLTSTNTQMDQQDLKNLNRPLQVISANMDEDSGQELVSCEFGFQVGGLSIWKKGKAGTWVQQVVEAQTGATRVIVKDFNQDGKQDMLALFAQGDERIILYLNQGKLQFSRKILLRFPPIYGTSSFDIADLDQDGDWDIVCTAGDNADFSTILKPYHGIYVFTNQGNFQFKQRAFYPQNGATKVLAADFDMDGDQDFVSIALFPDVQKRGEEGFLYWENSGTTWQAKSLPIQHFGRWSVMDMGDLDGDGDVDIALGSHAVAKFPEGSFDPAWKQAKGVLILRNQKR
ncbi:FG-GAP-like repeat-containing protein [Aquirufa beregesia]